MTNQEFDDIIKNKAYQRDAEVPEDIWENIIKQKEKRRIPFFWWMFLSLLLLTGTAVVWIINSPAGKFKTARREKSITETQKSNQQTAYNNGKENSGVKEEIRSITTSLPKPNDSATPIATAVKKENSVVKIQPGNGPSSMDDSGEKLVGSTNRSNWKQIKKFEDGNFEQAGNGYSKTGNKVISSKKRMAENQGVFKMRSLGGEIGNLSSDIVKNEKVVPTEVISDGTAGEKMDLLPQINTADSSPVKVPLALLADSSKKKQDPVVASLVKGKPTPNKKAGLKIEFAVSQVVPVQEYRRPLQTTRLVTEPGVTSQFVSDNITTSIESGTGFSVGLVKAINKKWTLGAGIQYLQFTELIRLSGVETNSDVNAISKTKTIIDGRNAYYNLTIPVFVHYSFAERRKWTAALRAGAYLDISRKYHNDIPGNFENVFASGIQSSVSKNNFGADIFVGLHVSHALSKRFEWFAEPAFRYNLSRYNSNTLSFNKKIHKPGISIGVSWQVGR